MIRTTLDFRIYIILFGMLLTGAAANELYAQTITGRIGGSRSAAGLPKSTVVVSPLFYVEYASKEGGPVDTWLGACDHFPLTTGGQEAGKIKINIVQKDGTSARLWNATTFQAALTASQLLDFDPRCMQVELAVRGNIGGPSAGCLLTVGVLASVLEHELDPRMTMTGTINPDGVVGPVGGITLKIEGAKEADKKIVLAPSKNRFSFDPRVGKFVDIIAHGQNVGVEVRLVNDVWAAYRNFTGQEIPRAPEADPPVLPPAALAHVGRQVPRWLKFYASAKEKYLSWSDRGHNDYANTLLEDADEYAQKAVMFNNQGLVGAAYWDALWSAILAWAAHEVGRVEFAYYDGGLAPARKMVADDDWLIKEMDKAGEALRAFKPETLEQLALYMEACKAFVEGKSYQRLAIALRSDVTGQGEFAENMLLTAAEHQTIAWIDMNLVLELLKLAKGYGNSPIPEDAPIDKLAEIYLYSAAAGHVVVDELKVKPLAAEKGWTHDQAIGLLYMFDPQFGVNDITTRFLYKDLYKYFGSKENLSYARLAVSTMLHVRSAMLIAKYYSLGLITDDEMNVTGITNEAALSDWLDDSQDQAQRAIGSLVKKNIDHTTATQIFSIGRVYESRGLEDRIESLGYYFQTNVTAQVLQYLNEKKVPKKAPRNTGKGK